MVAPPSSLSSTHLPLESFCKGDYVTNLVEQLIPPSSLSYTPQELWSHEASWRRWRPTRQLFIAMQLWDSSPYFLLGKSQPASGDLTVEQCIVTCQVSPAPQLPPSPPLDWTNDITYPLGAWQLLSPYASGTEFPVATEAGLHSRHMQTQAELCLWLPNWTRSRHCRWWAAF